jgi:hypothetical protein
VRTPENTKRVRTTVARSPKCSVHRHSIACNISSRSHQRVLQSDIRFHPYKRLIVQELSDPDFASRSAFYVQFITVMNEHPYIIRRLIISDGSHFELSACVNKQNVCNCSEANPNGLHMKQIHSQRVTVWSGISAFGIISPYFFEDETGSAVTVTSDRYMHMVNEFLFPE